MTIMQESAVENYMDDYSDHSFLGHPKTLPTVLGIELWERFSYYGMNALMSLYLIAAAHDGGLALPISTANIVIAVYGSLIFLTPSVWGWISDCLLGLDKMLLIVSVIVMVGHIFLGVFHGISGLLCGLILVGAGGGGVKIATQSLVGVLYSGDTRRESGFSLYYMAINTGAFFGPIIIASVHQLTGSWHWGFSIAALGIALGIGLYLLGRRNLPQSVHYPCDLASTHRIRSFFVILMFCCVAVAALWNIGVVRLENLAWYISIFAVVGTIGIFLGIFFSRKIDISRDINGVAVYIPVFIVSVVFWALYQQQFNVLEYLFTYRANRHMDIFGWQLTFLPEWFQSVNPIWIIVLSPIFSWLWLRLGTKNPSELLKTGMGVVLVGLVFLWIATIPTNASVYVYIVVMLVLTISELILSPTGMALMPLIAPRAFQSRIVILNLFASGIGTSLTGVISAFYDQNNPGPYFCVLGAFAVLIGLIYLFFVPYLQRKMPAPV